MAYLTFVRRATATVATATALLGAAAVPALADDEPAPPNCTAADLAGVMSGVAAATSAYLFTHPEVNDFFTGLKDLPMEEKKTEAIEYLDANPQVKAELQGIRQPSKDFHARCN